MNSSLLTNRKKEKSDCHSVKKKNKLPLTERIYANNISNYNKKEKISNKKIINLNGNVNKKEKYKKIEKNNKFLKLELSSIPKTIYKNKNNLTIIYSNNKNEKNNLQNSIKKINKVDKNNKTSKHCSFVAHNSSAQRIKRKKTMHVETKPKKNIRNNISNNKVNKDKVIQMNKKYFKYFSQINSKKVTNTNFQTVKNMKSIGIIKLKIDKEESLSTNKAEYKNRIRIIKHKNPNEKNNLNLKTSLNIYNSFLNPENNSIIYSKGKRNTEDISNDASTTSNNYYNESKNNYKNDITRESYKSYISKNETNSLKNSLTQSSKFSQSRKLKYKFFNNKHLVYKTELNLDNEKYKQIKEKNQNSVSKKKESKSIEKNEKYSHLSPINVHRKIFTFKKNEIIDITNRNNYIVIVKKICDYQNKKNKYFFDSSFKNASLYDENDKKVIEKVNNFDLIPKNIVMIYDKKNQMNVTIKPRKNLELRLFRHIKRNSVL